MSCPYTEVLSESRTINATRTGTSQTIVIEFQLPTDEETGELESPVFNSTAATFLGASDDVLALETAYSIIPLTRWLPDSNGNPLLLELESLNVSQVSNYDRWKAVAEYSFDSARGRGAGGQDPDDPYEGPSLPYMRFGFTVGGQTRNITTARSTPGKDTRVGGPALPAETMIPIGMTKDGIAGADVPGGGLTIQLTGFFYPETITIQYLKDLASLLEPTSSMNDAPFLTFLAGEVLITNVSGGGTLFDIVPITFDFNIKFNKNDEPDPPFPNLTCFGHDLLDYIYLEDIDANAQTQIMKPTYRYIHYVHKLGDFSKLKLPITG